MTIQSSQQTDTLAKYGIDFQIKCLSSLISDKTFIERMNDIIDPQSFESDAQRWLVKEIMNYFVEYKELPTLTTFKVKIDSVENSVLKQSIIDQLRLIYQKISDSDIRFVKEQFLEFCKNQKLKSAIMESVDHLQNGEYDRIKVVVDNALKAGMERNLGHDYIIDIDKRMSCMSRNCTKTNWTEVDTILDGGLAPGELGVITSPAGIGKSWILARLGAESMKQGKNVIHFTLELNENYVGLRYDCCFTSIDFQNVKNNVDRVKTAIEKIPGKLFIKYYPVKTASSNTLKCHIDRIQMLGTKIDMIIVDYADILRPNVQERNSNSYQDAGGIYEELRGIAGELQIPCWTASQCNRASLEDDIIQAESIADSYRKIMTADFVMSVSRKMNDKMANTARFHVIKNRFGPDGMTFPARFNAGNGDIQLYNEKSREGMSVITEMNEGENLFKKMLGEKWNSHKKEEDYDG